MRTVCTLLAAVILLLTGCGQMLVVDPFEPRPPGPTAPTTPLPGAADATVLVAIQYDPNGRRIGLTRTRAHGLPEVINLTQFADERQDPRDAQHARKIQMRIRQCLRDVPAPPYLLLNAEGPALADLIADDPATRARRQSWWRGVIDIARDTVPPGTRIGIPGLGRVPGHRRESWWAEQTESRRRQSLAEARRAVPLFDAVDGLFPMLYDPGDPQWGAYIEDSVRLLVETGGGKPVYPMVMPWYETFTQHRQGQKRDGVIVPERVLVERTIRPALSAGAAGFVAWGAPYRTAWRRDIGKTDGVSDVEVGRFLQTLRDACGATP